MLNPEELVAAAIVTCLVGGLLALIAARTSTVAGLITLVATAVSALMVYGAVGQVLHHGPSAQSATFVATQWLGLALLRLHVDGLTAVFLTLAATIAMPAALYSIVYMRHYAEYGVARYYPNFLLFLAAMYGLLSTTDMMWFFFMFWQMMTLSGYALIRYENRKPQNARAALKYLIMMQIACAATMIGAWLLTGGVSVDKFNFDIVSANLPALLAREPIVVNIAFGLFLIGFGIKMGMWPFGQIWLPDAHPAAPSPISAMLSGVMIKTGVYGLVRYFLWLPPPGAWGRFPLSNWGALIVVLGAITLFTGTMQALKQEQSKRLLAFHSIGQVGYILLGAGTCMALGPGSPLAALALVGALFHVLNHGLFKGLLFLNAGSMLHATGTQDLNKLGGLMKYMPITAVTALVASFSISGVPLFNGFASKWTIYAAAIGGGTTAKYLPVCAVIAILTSALTLASFIKFFGASFLSRTSQLVSQQAQARPHLEVSLSMQVPQVFLAAMCVLLGIVPAIAYRFLQSALANSAQGYGLSLSTSSQALAGQALHGIAPAQPVARFVPLALLAIVALMLLITWLIARAGGAQHRTAEPWLCGYVREADNHRYVAHNFYTEIKRYFRWLGGAPHVPAVDPLVVKDVK